MGKIKYLLIMIFLIFISGCSVSEENSSFLNSKSSSIDNYNNNFDNLNSKQKESSISINKYFKTEIKSYYRQIIGYKTNCLNGNCINKTVKPFLKINSCIFCANNSEVFSDKVLVYLGSTGGGTSVGSSCFESDSFSYPAEFKIIEKTTDKIIMIGNGQGYHKKTGNCRGGNYSYKYNTTERWILTTKKLGGETIIKINTSNNADIINAPGWPNPIRGTIPYSSNYLDIICTSPLNINVEPSFEVIQINGYNATYPIKSQYDREVYKNNLSATRLRFGAFYNGNYLIKPYCISHDAQIKKVYSNESILIKISGKLSKDLNTKLYIK